MRIDENGNRDNRQVDQITAHVSPINGTNQHPSELDDDKSVPETISHATSTYIGVEQPPRTCTRATPSRVYIRTS